MQLALSGITSFAKEVMFLVVFVCLSVCKQHYSKRYEQIATKFHGGVRGGTLTN